MFYISFSLHILPTFIERGGSFLVSNSYPELVGVGMLPYLIIYREVSQTSLAAPQKVDTERWKTDGK
mgnify:CR=1 FL=1